MLSTKGEKLDERWKRSDISYTNKSNETGDLRSVMKDADVFIGVSLKDLVDEAMVESMKRDPIIFAMANPDPEITPERAKQAGARVIGTGAVIIQIR